MCDLSSSEETISFWSFHFLQTDLFLEKRVFWMILFSNFRIKQFKRFLFKPLLLTTQGDMFRFFVECRFVQIVRTASNATPGMESFGGAPWLDGLRGPRPQCVQWPLATERNSSDVPQPRGRWRQPQPLKGGWVSRPANRRGREGRTCSCKSASHRWLLWESQILLKPVHHKVR